MAVFVAASDESSGKSERDPFYFAGWLAPEEDWSRFLTPAWQERVLDGPPQIPYLHMTEIRRPEWRAQYGLSHLQAEDRVDEAFALIDNMATLYPVCINIDAADWRDKFSKRRVLVPKRKHEPFRPDYMGFIGFAWYLLQYVAKHHPEAEKVDFIVERNGHITKYIQEFHAQLAAMFRFLELPNVAELVGELLPAGKERVPLQAADVLCWHTARAKSKTMDATDARRYQLLAKREGLYATLPPQDMDKIDDALTLDPRELRAKYPDLT